MDRVEDPEICPLLHYQLTFNKGAKAIYWEKEVFSTSGWGKTYPSGGKKERQPLLHT